MTDVNEAAEAEVTGLPESPADDGATTIPEDAQKVTDEGQAESPPADDDESKEEKKKPHWATRRIDELTRNWREAERRNDELLSLLKSNVAPKEPEKPNVPPTLEQHGYDEAKYQAALTDYVRGLTQAEARTVIEQERARVQQETRVQTFKQREAEFAATVEDYADKVYDPSLPLTPAVVELIAESDIGPKVAYYLADNPDIAHSLARLSPVQAAREFGKIEAKLSTSVAPKPVSKAPPPPPKMAAIEPEVDKDPDSMSTNEWLKWREKQLRKKGR